MDLTARGLWARVRLRCGGLAVRRPQFACVQRSHRTARARYARPSTCSKASQVEGGRRHCDGAFRYTRPFIGCLCLSCLCPMTAALRALSDGGVRGLPSSNNPHLPLPLAPVDAELTATHKFSGDRSGQRGTPTPSQQLRSANVRTPVQLSSAARRGWGNPTIQRGAGA